MMTSIFELKNSEGKKKNESEKNFCSSSEPIAFGLDQLTSLVKL